MSGCSAQYCKVEGLAIIYVNGTSCHIPFSLTGIIACIETKMFMRTASGTRYPIEGYCIFL